VAIAVAMLTACSTDTTPTISVVFNHSGEVIEPPLDGVRRVWTHKHALAAITKGQLDGRTRVWFGSYQGQPAWLAVTDNASVAIPGPPPAGGGKGIGEGFTHAGSLRSLAGEEKCGWRCQTKIINRVRRPGP